MTLLNLSDVTKAAEKFLEKFHPSLALPIPIEDIVERKMGIGLSVVPGIKALIGVDAFINVDFTQITNAAGCFTRFPQRTRFSIAHDIAHLILHKEYLSSHDNIDNKDYKFTEIQAQTFAGLILVPTDLLFKEIERRIGKVPKFEAPEILAPVAQDLLDIFQVSGEVMLRRLQRENIVKSNH